MRREQWYYDFLNGRELTAVASDIHKVAVGASDGGFVEIDEAVRAIKHALATWDTTHQCPYDDAVRLMLVIAAEEGEAWLSMMSDCYRKAVTP